MAFPFAPVGFALIAVGAWKDWNERKRSESNPGNPLLQVQGAQLRQLARVRGVGRLGYAAFPDDAAELRFQNGHNGPKKIQRAERHSVRTIQERAKYIKKALIEGSRDSDIITVARLIISAKCGDLQGGKRWCVNPKDNLGEVRALFRAVVDPNSPFATRYTNDHPYEDQFSSANLTMRVNAGDCDDFVIYLGAMLQAIGFPVKMRIVQDSGSPTWSHIYLLCDVAKGGGKWMALDPTEPQHPMGWQLEGADEVAKTGKPSGKTVAVLDVPVEQ